MWRGYCPKRYRAKPNIFELLFFNETTVQVPPLSNNDRKILFPFLSHATPESLSRALFGDAKTKKQEAKIINEVEGYIHSYDNDAMLHIQPPFYGKLTTDYEFYTKLLERYRHFKNVEQIFAPYRDYTIIGVHIRAGNGEVGDFEKYRQLGQGNLQGWLSNFTLLLKEKVLQDSSLVSQNAAIFVATDTASVVDYFRQAFQDSSVPILVTPQHYPTQGDGVSYNGYHENLTTCLDSWKYQMMDMVGLGEFADILIAGQYSSFTQSLPLSRLLNDNNNNQHRFFCDVDKWAQALKCYDSTKGMASWFAGQDAKFVGTPMDITTFAGPQVFLPSELDLASLQQLIGRGGGGPKKNN